MDIFAIIMLIFGGTMLLYAGNLWLFGSPKLIPRDYAVKMKDGKSYARHFAGVIALLGAAAVLGGLVAFTGILWLTLLTLAASLTGAIVLSVRLMHGQIDTDDTEGEE